MLSKISMDCSLTILGSSHLSCGMSVPTSDKTGVEASVKSLLPTWREVRVELERRDLKICCIPSSSSL